MRLSTHDPDAGFRTYKKPAGLERWHGFYHSRAVDDCTGLTLYGHVTSSSRTELSQYTDILRGIIRSTNPADKHGGLDDNNDDYEDDHLLTAALLDAHVLLPEAILGRSRPRLPIHVRAEHEARDPNRHAMAQLQ